VIALKTISFRLDDDMYKRLREVAMREHETVSEVVRKAVIKLIRGKHVVVIR